MHLEGNALDLFSWLSADREIAYWEELVIALQKNFGPAEFTNPDEYLCSIKQSGTVQEYRQEFAKRSSRVSGWPDKCLLGVFLNGLKDELKADVRIHKPRTVYKAMSIALEFESKLGHAQAVKNTAEHQISKANQLRQQAQPVISHAGKLPSHVPRLSEAEKQVRFQKGECYRCGDKYSSGHRCKTGTLRILEVEDDQGEQGCGEPEFDAISNKDDVEISLHALMGMPTNPTLIIPGLVNSFKVSVLIDCGSNHNFINDALLSKLGLTTNEVGSFGVRIGNGDVIHCKHVCKNVVISLGDLKITQDLYPFALGGADIVLGIQWLASLNTVKANWKKLFLRFTINGKDYELKGAPMDHKPAAVFRHFTIKTWGQTSAQQEDQPAAQIDTNRLEAKSSFGPGSSDTILAPLSPLGSRVSGE